MLATYAADEVGQRWGVDYVVNTPHFFKQIAGWIFFLFNKKENVLSLPHTVCEGPLLLVSMGVMLLSNGTWYGTLTTQHHPSGTCGQRCRSTA